MRLSTLSRTLVVAAAVFGSAASAQTTIAAARAAGVGQTVTVTGTVSRAKGAFAQIQDATAGLSIRQPAGTFFDAVAAGSIQPGTTLTVTGVLSEFRGLLQINAADLTSFTVDGQGLIPAAQTVTLAQLEAAGEAYESELVMLDGVTIAGAVTFTPATTYQITDATSSANVVALRIVGANDTDIDGAEFISPARITGVVGQFDTATPATTGYQIQPILSSDIGPTGLASEDNASAGLTLAVANPVRGAAGVRFGVATAGAARLTLVDVLGRTVAVLADGVAAGERTVTLNAAGLAPGVYVLRLAAGDRLLTRAVTVVR